MADSREERLERTPLAKDERPAGSTATGEIRFAPDSRLNVAYNTNCTHEEEVRQQFVSDVIERSEQGERATCPRCDQLAMRFVAVKTNVGKYAISACERCGYWYLM